MARREKLKGLFKFSLRIFFSLSDRSKKLDLELPGDVTKFDEAPEAAVQAVVAPEPPPWVTAADKLLFEAVIGWFLGESE